jgi:hypothetical protein
MTISSIELVPNQNLPRMKPIKEKMDIYVAGIPDGLSRRNGMIYTLIGSGGSGKTSLLLNLMKSSKLYRGKFHQIWYICPSASFCSVEKHPFKGHSRVYHELTVELLENIYNQLVSMKEEYESDEDDELMYNLIVFDDQADALKDKDIERFLNKMMIKARHLCTGFIFTLQSYLYMPRMLRKQITYTTIFKTNNTCEWEAISRELLHMNRDDAIELFEYVFDASYNHIDIDCRDNKLYKNFNQLLITKK